MKHPWIIFADPATLKPDVHKCLKIDGKWYIFGIDYTHREVAREIGEKVEAAGYVGVFDTFIRFDDPWSSTLKIGITKDHEQELAKLIGKPVRDR
jgi:hypothetical protein